MLLTVGAVQALALGDPREGVTAWKRIARLTERRGSPLDVVAYAMWAVWSPWRALRARALGALGDHDAARELADEELVLARGTGAPWLIGRGLRLRAELDGAAGVLALHEAVAFLEHSSARLEHAKAVMALARALAAAGRRDDAATQAGRAREVAAACGADALARAAGDLV